MAETEEDGVIARIVQSMGEIPSAHWDACAGDSDPFLSHAFLLALEESGCVHNRTGWMIPMAAPRRAVCRCI